MIVIKGARQNNLKNIDIEIPRDQLVVITGLSGSGKLVVAFDTIYAEGQRRYVESLSAYARQFLGQMDKPDVDYIGGLSPSISIDQKTTSKNPRSTVGTVTEIVRLPSRAPVRQDRKASLSKVRKADIAADGFPNSRPGLSTPREDKDSDIGTCHKGQKGRTQKGARGPET